MPRSHPVFLALTRTTCVLGVGVDYLFCLVIFVYAIFLLVNDPRALCLALPLMWLGRWCYRVDSALLMIVNQRLLYLNQVSRQQLGVYLYDPF